MQLIFTVLILERAVSRSSSLVHSTRMYESKSSIPANPADERSIILDGEMLVWDPVLDKYLAFGTLKTAASGSFGF